MTGAELPDALELHDVTALLYELLDAHIDTVLLAHEPVADEQWAAHLDYLRDLQRVGRATLARLPAPGEMAGRRG